MFKVNWKKITLFGAIGAYLGLGSGEAKADTGAPAAGVKNNRTELAEAGYQFTKAELTKHIANCVKHESRGDPSVVGDLGPTGGGWSYGMYQLESTGVTFKAFLKYIKKHDKGQELSALLEKAGGIDAARDYGEAGKNFRKVFTAWSKQHKEIAEELQTDFMYDNKYKEVFTKISKIPGMNLAKRGAGVMEAVLSIGNNHGRWLKIIKNAVNGNAENMSNTEIINRLYDARSEYVFNLIKNGKLDGKIGKALLKRYKIEQKGSLEKADVAVFPQTEVAKPQPLKLQTAEFYASGGLLHEKHQKLAVRDAVELTVNLVSASDSLSLLDATEMFRKKNSQNNQNATKTEALKAENTMEQNGHKLAKAKQKLSEKNAARAQYDKKLAAHVRVNKKNAAEDGKNVLVSIDRNPPQEKENIKNKTPKRKDVVNISKIWSFISRASFNKEA